MDTKFKGVISPRNERIFYQIIRKELLKPGIKNWFLCFVTKFMTRKVIRAFDDSVLNKLPVELKNKLILQINLIIDQLNNKY